MGNIAKRIKTFFTQDIPQFFQRAFYWARKNIARPAYNAVSDVLGGTKDLILTTEDKVIGGVESVVKTAGDTISNTAGNLTIPLAVGAAGLAAFMIFGKR